MKKRMICSERLITICALVNSWLCQESGIWFPRDITRRQWPMRALVSFTLQRTPRGEMRRTRLLGYLPQSPWAGWPAGFISTFFFIYLRLHNLRLSAEDKFKPRAFCLLLGSLESDIFQCKHQKTTFTISPNQTF